MPAAPLDSSTRAHAHAIRFWRRLWAAWLLAVLAGTHWPGLQLPTPPLASDIWALFQIDKIGHGCGFAGIILLGHWAWSKGRFWPTLLQTFAALGLAVVSEHTQQFAGGRRFDHGDIVANTTGVLAGFLITAPRPPAGRVTVALAWAARLCGLALCLPLYRLWATTEGGPDAMRAYQIMGLAGDRPDRQAHFWLAAALMLTVAIARPLGIHRPRASALASIACIAFLGPFMEVVQTNTGRGGLDLHDTAAHMRGLMVGLSVWGGLLIGRWLPACIPGLRPRPRPPGPGVRPATARPKHFVEHAAVVSGLTLVSRFTGLLRDAAMAAVFGLSWIADAFFVAFLFPNLFRRLFGEGALTAAFIPRYTRLREDDPQLAKRFATTCVSGLALLLIALTLAGEALLWGLLTATDDPEHTVTLRLAMVLLPYMPLICGVAFLGAVLQVHGRFGPPAGAPVLLNLVLVATAALAGPWAMAEGLEYGDEQRLTAAFWLAGATLMAGVLQLLWQLVPLLKITQPSFRTQGVSAHVKQMLATMLPMLIGLGVFQINALLDSLIAYLGSPTSGGSGDATLFGIDGLPYPLMTGDVAALQWAQRLYQFPLGVFGIAIATAIFPALARAANDPQAFGKTVRQGLRLTVFIGLPSTVGMIIVGLPLTRAVYERAAFSLQDAQHVTGILIGYSAAVWAYSMIHTLTRAFFALDDAKTPLRVSLVMVALNLALNLTLIWPLGAAGLAWSSAVCAALQALILVGLLSRKPGVDRVVDDWVLNGWLRSLALTAAMALVLTPLVKWAQPAGLNGWQNAALLLAATVGGASIYFGGAWLTKADELAWLRRKQQGRRTGS